MKVRFLGTGGFINVGIPYNSFLIDGVHLIEAPPDIMVSLNNSGVRYQELKSIFVSHFHGDHYFGLPFFILNLFNYYLETERAVDKIMLIGPRGLRNQLIDLQKIAVAPDNPSVDWIDQVFSFTEIDQHSQFPFGSASKMIFHRMNHAKETYGFSIIENGEHKLTYLSDTKWDESFGQILSKKPRFVICDLNGGGPDKIRAHMAEEDITKKAMNLTGKATKYIGTHLRNHQKSSVENLVYAKMGHEFEAGEI